MTPDEIEDVGKLEVATMLNGEVERSNAVANMVFSPWSLVSFHSRVMTLLPGDVAGCKITLFETLTNPVRR